MAKLAAAAMLMGVLWSLIRWVFFRDSGQNPFAHDLGYTSAMMLFFLASAGLLYLIVWDQRYRCRTCLRRLRMPMTAGSWPNMLLFGPSNAATTRTGPLRTFCPRSSGRPMRPGGSFGPTSAVSISPATRFMTSNAG